MSNIKRISCKYPHTKIYYFILVMKLFWYLRAKTFRITGPTVFLTLNPSWLKRICPIQIFIVKPNTNLILTLCVIGCGKWASDLTNSNSGSDNNIIFFHLRTEINIALK